MVNWKHEAIERLRNYNAKIRAQTSIPEDIARLKSVYGSVQSSIKGGIPVKGGNGNKREEALLSNIVERQKLREGLRQVRLWLSVFDRSLNALSPDDQLLLDMLYINPNKGNIERLCEQFGIEKNTVYYRRDRALKRFTIAMYGHIESD